MSTLSNGPTSGQDSTDPSILRATPELVRLADEALDATAELLGDEPVTSRRGDVFPPDPASRIAVRLDGSLLLSLEDAEGVNLSGRTIVQCLLLSADESAFVRANALDAHDDIAARLLGALPRAT